MGNLCGSSSSSPNKINDSKKEDPKGKAKSEVKLLLLGAGESGKSTFFKQVKILYEDGYSKEALLNYKNAIYANVLTTIGSMIKSCQKHNVSLSNEENKVNNF